MTAKYLFRLDDISWDMDMHKFNRIKNIFDSYDIKPLIGVIPNNEDPKLRQYRRNSEGLSQSDFWILMCHLQKSGWTISLHGYNHVYTTNESGILKRNNRSEFAGIPYEIQNEKIAKGKETLEENALNIRAFMAPAHSFDRDTTIALKNNEINVITDGVGFYPYKQYGITFVPQLFAKPFYFPFGIFTICLHANTMNDKQFLDIEKFILKNQSNVVDFDYILNSKYNKIQCSSNVFAGLLIKVVNQIIRIKGKLR